MFTIIGYFETFFFIKKSFIYVRIKYFPDIIFFKRPNISPPKYFTNMKCQINFLPFPFSGKSLAVRLPENRFRCESNSSSVKKVWQVYVTNISFAAQPPALSGLFRLSNCLPDNNIRTSPKTRKPTSKRQLGPAADTCPSFWQSPPGRYSETSVFIFYFSFSFALVCVRAWCTVCCVASSVACFPLFTGICSNRLTSDFITAVFLSFATSNWIFSPFPFSFFFCFFWEDFLQNC